MPGAARMPKFCLRSHVAVDATSEYEDGFRLHPDPATVVESPAGDLASASGQMQQRRSSVAAARLPAKADL
jgi:hypothetical protein